MAPTISYIIPSYNELGYIEACLKSIYQQHIDNDTYEVIVVDNGSKDGTSELASTLGAHVIVNNRRGAAASRNLGANHAQGSLLAFIDADCIVAPNWINVLIAHFSSPHIAAAAAPALPIVEGMTWVEKAWAKVFVNMSRPSRRNVITVSNLPSSNLLILKKYFDEVGGFDEKFLSCEDYDLSQRLLMHGQLLLDENVHVTHLRESKTVCELFNRELGRGKYSLRCYIKNGYSFRELPSILIPFLNILTFCSIFIQILLKNFEIALYLIVIFLLTPIILLARGRIKFESTKSFLQDYFVAATYVEARSTALLIEIFCICKELMSTLKNLIKLTLL